MKKARKTELTWRPGPWKLLIFWLLVCGPDSASRRDTLREAQHTPGLRGGGRNKPCESLFGLNYLPLVNIWVCEKCNVVPVHRVTLNRRRRHQAPSLGYLVSYDHLLNFPLLWREICSVVKGTGAYLALLLVLQGVEPNPGPQSGFSKEQENFLLRLNDPIRKDVSEIATKITNIETTLEAFKELEKEVTALRTENQDLRKRVEVLERQSRSKNFIIFGAPDKRKEIEVLDDVAQRLGFERRPDIEDLYRFGKKEGKRPIMVKLKWQGDKADIMSRVGALKGSGLSVQDDLTPQELTVRRTIVAAAKEAREAGVACKVRRTGLLIKKTLIPAVDLTHPGWLQRHNWLFDPDSAPPPADTLDPGEQAVVLNTANFRETRSHSTGSNSSNAGDKDKKDKRNRK
jgi:hypothetical protein